MSDKPEPDDKSSDMEAMAPYWAMANTMLAGTDAMRAAGKRYLPKFPQETESDYAFRLANAKFTNIFGDIIETLAAKPFAKEVTVKGATPDILKLVENIDGQGNHLHRFSASTFHSGVANGMAWILVDYTKTGAQTLTVADERALGVRPYWVNVDPKNVVAVYSATIGGMETIVHIRIEECTIERVGFGEREIERVRIFDRELFKDGAGQLQAKPATWAVWEEQENQTTKKKEWVEIETGLVTIGVIPMVPVWIGQREGSSFRLKPPMAAAAFLQIEHYQQESGLKYAREMTCFPMLAGNGIEPPMDEATQKPKIIPVGPKTVLFAPPNGDGQHGEWSFVEPSAQSLTFLADQIKATEDQLRELGRQPLTAKAGNITTVTAAFAGDKALTVIEAWALNLKDALEKAFALTALWLKQDAKVLVDINTDFALDLKDDNGVGELSTARANGDLSRETYWSELRRRNILGPNFDPEEEAIKITDEQPADMSPADLAAAMGQPVPPEGALPN